MKVYLLPKDGQFYKANMHSHSTLSDGHITPQELKEVYKKRGYSVFAYTEHGTMHDLRHLNDDKFITIPSYELAFYRNMKTTPFPALWEGESPTPAHAETIHMNLFQIDPDATLEAIDISDIQHDHSVENINEAIRRAKAAGFFVSYNHPHWSLNTGSSLYNHLEGVDALEIINGACYRSSGLDYVPHVYREMAWHGKRLVCIAGDDNHHFRHFFWAWTMIKAPELSHKAVMQALQAGNCYASAGPEIKELYVEDGVVHIETSEAQGIYFSVAGRRKDSALITENDGQPVTSASFKLNKLDIFFHITVKDLQGRPANTRIFYLDEADFGITD